MGDRMDVGIVWQDHIELGSKSSFIKKLGEFDLGRIPTSPGIYIFARKFGNNLAPIYIGKATNLRSRVKTQLNNHRLLDAIANEKSGDRVLLLGIIKSNSENLLAKKLNLAERTHIDHALTAGFEIVNVQLTKGPINTIRTLGTKRQNHPFPHVMLSKH